jgi:peptidoglycan/LPS O-acetylase OafA/YrhL
MDWLVMTRDRGRAVVVKQESNRIGAIDGLRGIAAVTVAFVFHWQHLGGAQPPSHVWFLSPRPLQWLQLYGWLGVDMFFLLSGFIFARNYAEGIASGRVGGHEFFVRRLSRLYPLHVLTLVAAGGIAWLSWLRFRGFPIYAINDMYHFFLNLLFAQSIGLETGYSFNGPSWSLSLEAVCYAAFFVVCQKATRNRVLLYVALAFAGASLLKINPPTMPLLSQPLGRAFTGFFCGCLICSAVNAGALPWLRWAALVNLLFGTFTVVVFGGIWAAMAATFYLSFDLAIFPCVLICCLGFAPLRVALSSRPFQFLGDLSYSIYLLHAVMQMAIILLFRLLNVAMPGTSFWFYATYVGSVVMLAAIVHRFFEMPAQSWLRGRLLPGKRVVENQAAASPPVRPTGTPGAAAVLLYPTDHAG